MEFGSFLLFFWRKLKNWTVSFWYHCFQDGEIKENWEWYSVHFDG